MFPIFPDEEHDEAGYEIRDCYVGKEPAPLNVTDGEHGEDITLGGRDVLNVVYGVDGYQDSTTKQGDAGEHHAHHAGKT